MFFTKPKHPFLISEEGESSKYKRGEEIIHKLL